MALGWVASRSSAPANVRRNRARNSGRGAPVTDPRHVDDPCPIGGDGRSSPGESNRRPSKHGAVHTQVQAPVHRHRGRNRAENLCAIRIFRWLRRDATRREQSGSQRNLRESEAVTLASGVGVILCTTAEVHPPGSHLPVPDRLMARRQNKGTFHVFSTDARRSIDPSDPTGGSQIGIASLDRPRWQKGKTARCGRITGCRVFRRRWASGACRTS